MPDNLSSASIQAANQAPSAATQVRGAVDAVEATASKDVDNFLVRHEWAIVIGAIVAVGAVVAAVLFS